MNKVDSFLFAGLLLAAVSCLAGQAPAPRIVDLTAGDGIKLKASYFPAGKPGPGVLLLHQCDHDRKIWDGLAQQLAAAGINVLTMDLRGFDDSGDTPHTGKTGRTLAGRLYSCAVPFTGRGRRCWSDQEPSLTTRSVVATQPVTNG
jgi:hypothetical protein